MGEAAAGMARPTARVIVDKVAELTVNQRGSNARPNPPHTFRESAASG